MFKKVDRRAVVRNNVVFSRDVAFVKAVQQQTVFSLRERCCIVVLANFQTILCQCVATLMAGDQKWFVRDVK